MDVHEIILFCPLFAVEVYMERLVIPLILGTQV